MEINEVKSKISSELRIQGKSEQTVRVYLLYNLDLLNHTKKAPEEITSDDIKQYLAYLLAERQNSAATIALARSAISFFYDSLLKRNLIADIKTPKKERKIPDILTKEEVKQIINKAPNLRTKLLIEFMYSSGLRVSECASLRWNDIDINEKVGLLKKGKGKKDRLFIISDKLIKDLKKWPQKGEFIFQTKEEPISTRTIQRSVKTAAKLAGIKKKVYCHLLRHSFATHLLESGVDIRIIQELLAHSNLQTTQFYTNISRKTIKSVKSPLDDIF